MNSEIYMKPEKISSSVQVVWKKDGKSPKNVARVVTSRGCDWQLTKDKNKSNFPEHFECFHCKKCHSAQLSWLVMNDINDINQDLDHFLQLVIWRCTMWCGLKSMRLWNELLRNELQNCFQLLGDFQTWAEDALFRYHQEFQNIRTWTSRIWQAPERFPFDHPTSALSRNLFHDLL